MPHSDCIVYLDSLIRNSDGTLSAYIDFRREEDVDIFKAYSPDNRAFDDSRTFIRLESFRTTKRLVHDCYYKLNLGLLNQYQAVAEGDNGHPESNMLAYLNGLCGGNIKRTDMDREVVEGL